MDFLGLKAKLLTGDFDVLVGLIEDEHFDAKVGKYDLSSDGGKLELAKDVSSFANRSGGIILIGARTTDDPAFFGRRVDSVNTFPLSIINPVDYHNVIKEWIYPAPEKIEAEWVPSKNDSAKGLFFILIPNQSNELRPFLIRKDVDPATNLRRKEILFGYVERVSHSSDPVNVMRMHTLLRYGRENQWREEVANRLAAIESTLSQPPEEKKRKENLQEIVKRRVDDSIKACMLDDKRVYALVISPIDRTEVQTFLSSTSDSIARQIEEPPLLRYGGWGLDTGGRAILASGELRRAKCDEYKIVDLWRDGTLISIFRADEELLGWGPTFGNARINPLTLVELTYMFFSFYEFVLKKLSPPITKLNAWWIFRNLHQRGEITTLAPGPIEQTSGRGYFHKQAPNDSVLGIISTDSGDFDPPTIAVKLLREVYAWFGIEENRIPYLIDDGTAVNVELIKHITR